MGLLPLQPLLVLVAALALTQWPGASPPPPEWLTALRLPAWGLPLLIFLMITANNALDTLRTLSLARGLRLAAWVAGFAQALLFVTAAAGLLTHLDNLWNLVAYALGFSTGNVLGILVETRLAPGQRLVRIISSHRGTAIVQALRQHGWGATEISGRGQEGTVSLIWCHVPRRELAAVRASILELDPEAFITAEAVRLSRGGWRA